MSGAENGRHGEHRPQFREGQRPDLSNGFTEIIVFGKIVETHFGGGLSHFASWSPGLS